MSDYQWVSQLIDLNTNQWNISLLRQLFTTSQVGSILTIPLQLDQKDSLIWPFTLAGIFTTRSSYSLLCTHQSSNSTPLSSRFWLKFWKANIPYKLQIFMWKIFLNCLSTKKKLFHATAATSLDCVLCNTHQIEDLDHLLVHCPFSAAIWRYFLPQVYQNLNSHQSFLSWVQTWKSSYSYISIYHSTQIIHIIACILNSIWKHRCQVIFNNASLNLNTVIHSISAYIQQHILTASATIISSIRSMFTCIYIGKLLLLIT